MSRAGAQVVGHAFQTVGEIQAQGTNATNQREDGKRQDERRAFEALELHPVGLNKKPAQLKAALVENRIGFVQSLFINMVMMVKRWRSMAAVSRGNVNARAVHGDIFHG